MRWALLLTSVLLLGCRSQEAPPQAEDAATAASVTSSTPCTKLAAMPGAPADNTIEACEQQLAGVRKKDPERHACYVKCIDSQRAFAEFRKCTSACPRNLPEQLGPEQIEHVSPVAVCKTWRELQEKAGKQVSDAGVASCEKELEAMKRDRPQRFACHFECTSQLNDSWTKVEACRSACK